MSAAVFGYSSTLEHSHPLPFTVLSIDGMDGRRYRDLYGKQKRPTLVRKWDFRESSEFIDFLITFTSVE